MVIVGNFGVNLPISILLTIPSTNASVLCLMNPSEVTSNRRNWKNPAGPE